jgi:hypothetical protein
MTRILYHQPTTTLVPYPRDDDGPVIDLDPAYLELALIQEAQPDYDPNTQQLTPTEVIDLTDLVVTRGWNVVPLPPPPPPAPDWESFGSAMLASPGINALLAAALPLTPAPALALPATLVGISSGLSYVNFSNAWAAVTAAVPPSAELLAEVLAAAEAAHLPAEFLAILQPSP